MLLFSKPDILAFISTKYLLLMGRNRVNNSANELNYQCNYAK